MEFLGVAIANPQLRMVDRTQGWWQIRVWPRTHKSSLQGEDETISD